MIFERLTFFYLFFENFRHPPYISWRAAFAWRFLLCRKYSLERLSFTHVMRKAFLKVVTNLFFGPLHYSHLKFAFLIAPFNFWAFPTFSIYPDLVHCIQNEVFHLGFLQKMWPNPQETEAVNVTKSTFTEEILNGKLHFLCSGFATGVDSLLPSHISW